MFMKYAEMKKYADSVAHNISTKDDMGGEEFMELMNHARMRGGYDFDKISEAVTTAYYLGVLIGRDSKSK